MSNNRLLIENQYLPPISFFALLLQYDEVILEKWEHFQKSTYRNRCYIAGPNGKLRLTVPLEKGKQQRSLMKDVRISYEEDWKKNQWQSLCSCYRRSPFFEYYERDFEAIYQKHHEYLFQLNYELIQLLLRLMGINKSLSFSESYIKNPPQNIDDKRSLILPNNDLAIENYHSPKYWQVFEEKTGFFEDLSIVDLLFNEGPNTVNILKSAMN